MKSLIKLSKLAAVISPAILPAGAFAASLSVSPSTASVAPNGTVTVEVKLDTQGVGVSAVDIFSLRFNPAVLEVVDADPNRSGVQIQAGTLLTTGDIYNKTDNTAGTIDFSQSVPIGSDTVYNSGQTPGTLATITFKAKASSGSSTLNIDFTAGSTSDSNVLSGINDVLSSVKNGSVSISAPALDTDGDGIPDATDPDDDNDGTQDNSDCASLDKSKWRNQAFADPDNDGVRNSLTASTVACFGSTAPSGYTLATNAVIDNCPSVSNPDQKDTDGDKIGDACDTANGPDTDGDGIPDSTDPDDDNDGTQDTSDCASLDKLKWRNQAYADPDNDGVRNSLTASTVACFGTTAPSGYTLATNSAVDNCPNVSNPDQKDTDGDKIGDACDTANGPDTDGDGIPDSTDPDDDNDTIPDASDCASLDKLKWRNQAYSDPDNDGVRNSLTASSVTCFGNTPPSGYTLNTNAIVDNCPSVANPDQKDTDKDGKGDACDTPTEANPSAPTGFTDQ